MIEQYFVVEGMLNKMLLESLLPPAFASKTKFIVSEGYTTAISKARSILVSSPCPVYIMVDSGTTDLKAVDEKKDFISQMLNLVSAPDKFKIIISIPETEILLFYDKSIFESIFSVRMDELQWERAKYEPRKTLTKLIPNNDLKEIGNILSRNLTEEFAEKLRKNKIIQNIISNN